MKIIARTLCLYLPVLLVSCVTSVDLIEVGRGMAERTGKPKPEEEWNRLGIWRRVSDDPPTYVPASYAASSPRTDKDGTWYTDKRDGKKLFVPHVRSGLYEPGVLRGEAVKVTTWTRRQYSGSSPGIMNTSGSGIMSAQDVLMSLPQSR